MRWGRVGPAATAAYITPTSATPGHIYPSYRGREVGDGGVWSGHISLSVPRVSGTGLAGLASMWPGQEDNYHSAAEIPFGPTTLGHRHTVV